MYDHVNLHCSRKSASLRRWSDRIFLRRRSIDTCTPRTSSDRACGSARTWSTSSKNIFTRTRSCHVRRYVLELRYQALVSSNRSHHVLFLFAFPDWFPFERQHNWLPGKARHGWSRQSYRTIRSQYYNSFDASVFQCLMAHEHFQVPTKTGPVVSLLDRQRKVVQLPRVQVNQHHFASDGSRINFVEVLGPERTNAWAKRERGARLGHIQCDNPLMLPTYNPYRKVPNMGILL